MQTQVAPLAIKNTPYDSRVLSGPRGGAARVEGAFPPWLKGRLVRTAPALFELNGWRAEHWFDALGMLYSFHIDPGGSVSWMQRLLDCDARRAAASTGKVPYATFGSGNGRSCWRRLVQPVPVPTDNTNVNVIPFGDEWIALTESSRQLAIDPESLKSKGEVVYDDDLPRGLFMSAHPLYDVAHQVAVNLGTNLGARAEIIAYEHDVRSRSRRKIARLPLGRLPYVHSFGMTAEELVVVAHPFDVAPASLLWSNRFVERFSWRPDEGTTLYAVDRATGAVRSWEADPFFVFHTVNAFRDKDDLVLDLLAYDDASIIEALRVDALLESMPDQRARLVRVRMGRGKRAARVEPLCDVGFEFPAISYRWVSGRKHRYVWGASIRGKAGAVSSEVVRVDLGDGGRAQAFSSGSFVFGEPIFVARPGAGREDDGVLLAVGADPQREEAQLVALDAASLEPIARAFVEVPIPLGYHGSFARE